MDAPITAKVLLGGQLVRSEPWIAEPLNVASVQSELPFLPWNYVMS